MAIESQQVAELLPWVADSPPELKVLESIRKLFAACKSWQSICGCENAADAKRRIFIFGDSEEATNMNRPKCYLLNGEHDQHFRSPRHSFGTVEVAFEFGFPPSIAGKDQECQEYTLAAAGEVVREACVLGYGGSTEDHHTIRKILPVPDYPQIYTQGDQLGPYGQHRYIVHRGLLPGTSAR